MIDLIKRSNFCLETFFYFLQFAIYNTKSGGNPLHIHKVSEFFEFPGSGSLIVSIFYNFESFKNLHATMFYFQACCIYITLGS